MGGDKRIDFVLPRDGDAGRNLLNLATNFANSSGLSSELSKKFVGLVNESARKILLNARDSINVSLSADKWIASLFFSGKKLPIGVNVFRGADEVLATFDENSTRVMVSVYAPEVVKKPWNFVPRGRNFEMGQIRQEDIPRASALWNAVYGKKSPWLFMSNPGKMAQMISSRKALVVGIYSSKELVGLFGVRMYKNPFYALILPPVLPEEARGYLSKWFDSIVSKLRLLSPGWILAVSSKPDSSMSTQIGFLRPEAMMVHHLFREPYFIFGKKLTTCEKSSIFLPEKAQKYFKHLIRNFDMNLKIGNASTPAETEGFKFVLRMENANQTATLRFVGFGNRVATALEVITSVFKSIVKNPSSTFYVDLPLMSPFTRLIGEKLISAGFGLYGYIPGHYLRFQKVTGVQVRLPDVSGNEVFSSLVETF